MSHAHAGNPMGRWDTHGCADRPKGHHRNKGHWAGWPARRPEHSRPTGVRTTNRNRPVGRLRPVPPRSLEARHHAARAGTVSSGEALEARPVEAHAQATATGRPGRPSATTRPAGGARQEARKERENGEQDRAKRARAGAGTDKGEGRTERRWMVAAGAGRAGTEGSGFRGGPSLTRWLT